MKPKDKIQGRVVPAVTDTSALPCDIWRAPNRLQVNYVSGVERIDGRLPSLYAQLIARMACGRLPDRSGTTNTEAEIDYWRGYPTSGKGDRETLMISPQTQNNPFGLRRCDIWAWGIVMTLNERHLAGAI